MELDRNIATIFKTEYSNLIAVLCRIYGMDHLALIEDVLSEAFLEAMRTWSHKGVPSSPVAWLRTVSTNKLKDHFRRDKTYREAVLPQIDTNKDSDDHLFSDDLIRDSQVNMFFAVCHPSISPDAQLCLSLRILSGFSIDEIATAMLSNKATVNKKLYRAKQKLKAQQKTWLSLSQEDYTDRLPGVLKTIYLVFNEGYYSSVADIDVRQEMCWEAMRYALFLSHQDFLPRADVFALIALMCFHTSRFKARLTTSGEIILLEDQDRSLWDQDLINKGKNYLTYAAGVEHLSIYHLEAAIAYWHTTDHPDRWNNILQLYNKLLTVQYSPIAALNRTYALAKANSIKEAIVEAKKLDLQDNHLYHSLLAALYEMDGQVEEQGACLKRAISLAKKESESALLKKKLQHLSPSK